MRTNKSLFFDLAEIRDTLLITRGCVLFEINQKHLELLIETINNYETIDVEVFNAINKNYKMPEQLAQKIRSVFIEHTSSFLGKEKEAMKAREEVFSNELLPELIAFVDFFYEIIDAQQRAA